MRERNILYALLALNLALLFAFSSYLVLSMHHGAAAGSPSGERAVPKVPPEAPVPKFVPPSDPHVLQMAAADPTFTFRDVETTNYAAYLKALKRAGCPDQHLRQIVMSDVEALFAEKRLQEAIRHDFEWWRADPQPIIGTLLREKGQELAEQQQQLAERLLGRSVPACAQFWTYVPLTGSVLGALSEKLHGDVQEVCRPTMTRATADPALAINSVAVARAREEMRAELARILTAQQLEEFLLRYSEQAVALRKELRELQPTADEFRKAFAAVEPIDRELQREFGTVNALAAAQVERYQRRRIEALQSALAPERYAVYALAHKVH